MPADRNTRESLFPDGHDGLDVTNERIKQAHSAMHTEWLKGDEETHFAYKQGHDERCYICALLARTEMVAKALLFYADPLNYFGIGIFPDPPAGEFAEDIEEVPWPDGGTNYKPGKRAREALRKAFPEATGEGWMRV